MLPWVVFAKSRPLRLVPCNANLPDLTVHIGTNTATVTGTSMLGLPINASSFSNFSTPGESPFPVTLSAFSAFHTCSNDGVSNGGGFSGVLQSEYPEFYGRFVCDGVSVLCG